VGKARPVCKKGDCSPGSPPCPMGTDPDEFVRARGAEALQKNLEASRGMLEYLIENAVERFGWP